jgi:hypothetical protein
MGTGGGCLCTGGGDGGTSRPGSTAPCAAPSLPLPLPPPSRKLSLARKVQCGTCTGTGSRSGKRYECNTCHGSGVQVHIRPIGPGMVQQIQARCSECNGSGSSQPHSECRLRPIRGTVAGAAWLKLQNLPPEPRPAPLLS